jgi:glycosyltransferase involved in cell wall biosynthesis
MFIFSDYVVCNGIDFITTVINKTIPFVDAAVVVDTGSTDGTLEVCQALAKKYDKLRVIDFGSLAPHYDIYKARQAGWDAAPPETTWHWHFADDEIHNVKEIPRLIQFLKDHEHSPQRFVRLHFWEYGQSGIDPIQPAGPYSRAMIHRWQPDARWIGKWGREGLVYPDEKHHVNADPSDYLDPNYYFHHVNWLRAKQNFVESKYKELWG